jgi:hypothetical protein
MRETLFIAISGLGFLFIVLFGNYILKSPGISATRFAGFIGGAFALLISSLVLLTGKIDIGKIILSLILAAINFGVGYPIAYFYYQYRFKRS